MCETCSNVAHLGCTGLDSEPDLGHCGEGGCPAVESFMRNFFGTVGGILIPQNALFVFW